MLKASIIVPVYNVENYLRQCLDSLIAQTLHDIEIICIDDGSTDSSLSILNEYEMKDERVRVISKENEGYGKTMNRGFEEAQAPYIGIVESDDFTAPEMYEKLYKAMENQKVDLVKCNFYKYTADSKENIEYSREYDRELYGQVLEPIDYPELYSAHSSVWAALYSKQFLNENQIRFNETPGASFQDVAFQFRVLSSAKRMLIIPDALLYYRTDNLMSSVNSPYKIYCIFDEIHAMEKYVKEQPQDRQNKLWPILENKKYYEYRWHCWERLSAIFQFAFFEKMVDEFKVDYEAGRFEKVIWRDPYEQMELKKMLADRQAYFMEKIEKQYEQYYDSRIDLANTLNAQLPEVGLFYLLKRENVIIVYGAGKIGRYAAELLKLAGIEKEKLIFAVSDIQNVETKIDGIDVKQIDKALHEYRNGLVLVAAKGEKQIVMLNYLKDLGCKEMIVVDNQVLMYLQKGK